MRVLVATSGTSEGDAAVHLGGIVSALAGGELRLLHVIKQEADQDEAEALLLRAQTLLDPAPPRVERVIRSGQPAEEIALAAAEGRADLVVVGDHGQTGLARRLLPPTAEQVLQRISCPLLIARGTPRPLRRVLICEARRQPSLLQSLPEAIGGLLARVEHVTLLHVMSQIAAAPGVVSWELQADAEALIREKTPEGALLAADLARLQALGVRPGAKVRHGRVVDEILDEAQGGDYDLLMIGAHQGGGWARFLLDDLAREIIGHSDRPTLVI